MNTLSSFSLLLAMAAVAGKLPSSLPSLLRSPHPVQRMEISPALPADAEARELIGEVSPRIEVLVNPLMGKILNGSRVRPPEVDALKASLLLRAGEARRRWGTAAERGAALAVFLSVGVGVLSCVLGLKGIGRFLGEAGLSACRGWVMGLSLLGAGLFAGAEVSLWLLMPRLLWGAPLAGMLLNAGLLRLVDLNHPVWNRLLSGLLAPVAAATFIILWGRVIGRPLF